MANSVFYLSLETEWTAMLYNYYKILGVSEKATQEEIRRAYRAKAKIYHPDKSSSAKAHELFSVLNDAHSTLTSAAKKEIYDLKLQYSKFQANGAATNGNSASAFGSTPSSGTYTRPQAPKDIYGRPVYAQREDLEGYEPSNVLFYSFFSAGTLCGVSFLMAPIGIMLAGHWSPVLLAPLVFGILIIKDGVKEMLRQAKIK